MRFNAFKYYAMLFKGLTTAGQMVQLSQKMLLTQCTSKILKA